MDELDTREARPQVLAAIDELLITGAVTSVHYAGYAHESVFRLLHRHLGTAFSVMDFADRYHTGVEFFWEEADGDYPYPHRPDWLEGVLFYQEGVPNADLLIWDMPCSHPGQLAAIIDRSIASHHQPTHLFLVDEACSEASHPAYSWAMFPFYALGTLKSAPIPAPAGWLP